MIGLGIRPGPIETPRLTITAGDVDKIILTPFLHGHQPITEQHRTLSQKLRGHFAYYGITGNGSALSRFRYEAIRVWWKWLARRKRADRYPWARFERLLEHYPLPRAVAVHSVCRPAANP